MFKKKSVKNVLPSPDMTNLYCIKLRYLEFVATCLLDMKNIYSSKLHIIEIHKHVYHLLYSQSSTN